MTKEDLLQKTYDSVMSLDEISLSKIMDKEIYTRKIIEANFKAVATHYNFKTAEEIFNFINKANEVCMRLYGRLPMLFLNTPTNITTIPLNSTGLKEATISGLLINRNVTPEVKQDLIINYINLIPEVTSVIDTLKSSYYCEKKIRITRNILKAGNERPSQNTEIVFNKLTLKNLTVEAFIKEFIPEKTWNDSFKLLMRLI